MPRPGRWPLAGIALLALGWLAATTGSSAEPVRVAVALDDLQPRARPITIGVGVHFGIGDRGYDAETSAAAIRDIGFTSYRDDLAWPAFDRPGGAARAPEPRQLFDFMRRTEARPVLILGHGNSEVPGGDPPLDEAGRDAFASFAARAARETRAFDPIFEIWNEWNLTARFTTPFLVGPGEPDDPRAAANYAALAKAAVPAVAAAAPGNPILVGAVGVDAGWGWTDAIVRDGALAAPSRLSVHLYNHCERDTGRRNATEMIDRLAQLQRMLSGSEAGAEPVPISVTEFGWPTDATPCPITRQDAADSMAQFVLWSAATPWVDGVWVYELKDQGRDPSDLEANFGLYDHDDRPKPAVCALRDAIELVKAAGTTRLYRPRDDVFLLAMGSGRDLRVVVWTSTTATHQQVKLERGGLRARTLCGSEEREATSVEIGPTPVVLRPAEGGVTRLVLDISTP